MSHQPQTAAKNAADKRPDLEWIGLAALITGFLYLSVLFFIPAYFGGIDESCYMLQAKTLARTGQPVFHTKGPLLFVPENMVERSPDAFVAKYPGGYPLLAAVGYCLAGPPGAFYVNPLMAVAALLGSYFLARQWLGVPLALAGGVTLALHPMMLWHANGALSHMSETAFCVWGILLAVRWSNGSGWWTAMLAGLLLGYACSIRYTAALTILPVAVLVAQRFVRARPEDRRHIVPGIVAFAAAALVALVPLFIYQAAAFGSPFSTGYALTNESRAFSLHWFLAHAWTAIVTLNTPGYGLVVLFPLAIAWLGYALVRDRRRGLFLTAWIVPPLLLYMAYHWVPGVTHSANYLRFFFQLFPPLLVASLLLIERVTRGSAIAKKAAAILLCILALACFVASPGRTEFELSLAPARYAQEAAVLVNKNVPRGATVVGDATMCYFLLFATDDDIYNPDYFYDRWIQRHESDLQPGGIHVFNPLRAQRFFAALGSRRQPDLDARFAGILTQAAVTPKGAYLLTNAQSVTYWRQRLGPWMNLVPVQTSPYDQVLLKLLPRPAAKSAP
jgi:4-amino-4-deoxy-L-arabinose transferase-like glycosyltransferase